MPDADRRPAVRAGQPAGMARLRFKLTATFAVAMAAVLVASGGFVYQRVSRELLAAVDRDLGARSDALVVTLGRDPGLLLAGTHRFADPDEAFAQVLDRSGDVVDGTPGRSPSPLLNPNELRALAAPRFLTRPSTAGVDAQRLLAVPAKVQGAPRVVVVGATLGDRQDALAQLLTALVLVGVVATVLALWGAWLVAGAALAPVAAAVRRERRLVDDASHELRTPLSVLKAELDLALSRPRNPAELHRTLEAASRETDRLVGLTEDLLVLARQRQGVLPLRPQALALRALADSALAGLRPPPEGRTINVRADDVIVQLDPERVRQILVNLVDNALKHGRGTVTVRLSMRDNTLRLDVADEGDGLPEALRHNDFAPFRRGHAGTDLGAGLGLAIVKGITDAIGGKVVAYREPNHSGVRVDLPAAALGRASD
jgi:two-component system OmpR family sensor kinase